jgi:hypothetical protein
MTIEKQFGASNVVPPAVDKSAPSPAVNAEGLGGGGTAPALAPIPDDKVVLSGPTGRVANALEQAQLSHAERVARLTEEVRSGRYQVDAQAVAQSLVEDSLADGAAPSAGSPASPESVPNTGVSATNS